MDRGYAVVGDPRCDIDNEEPENLDSFEAQVGWRKNAEIVLIAGPNLPECHSELAAAAIAVVRLLGGVIDLGGTLDGTGGLRGHRWSIPYRFDAGELLEYWVVGVEWLEGWLLRPEFRMVK